MNSFSVTGQNRELKAKLLDADKYRELVSKAQNRVKELEEAIKAVKKAIEDTKASEH